MLPDAPRTLLLGSRLLPSSHLLAATACDLGWNACYLDDATPPKMIGYPVYYGGTDRVEAVASQYNLNLISPALDLLARTPGQFTCRNVRFGTLASIARLPGPIFVKPADPIRRVFDAGVYRSGADVHGRRPLDPATPVVISEVVEWTSEFRCFIADSRVEAWSPYLSYGRPIWHSSAAGEIPVNLQIFCNRLLSAFGSSLPAAFVVDVGVMQDGRWAVVEYNPAWCSGILGAKVAGVLNVITRAAGYP